MGENEGVLKGKETGTRFIADKFLVIEKLM